MNQSAGPRPASEAELVAGFRDRDEQATRDVVRRYRGPMTVLARRLLADPHRADDAVQQAFLQAWRAAGTVDPARPLGPWLFTITRRVCIDLHRRDRRADIPTLDAAQQADRAVEAVSVDALHRVWEVRRVLDELPARERTVVQLQHLDGLTHTQIADQLQLPLGTVKSRSRRAHLQLAKLLEAERPGVLTPAECP